VEAKLLQTAASLRTRFVLVISARALDRGSRFLPRTTAILPWRSAEAVVAVLSMSVIAVLRFTSTAFQSLGFG
jgi:hypothetical protein